MIGLVGGVIDGGEDVVTLQKRVIGQNFIEGRACAEKLQNVGDAKALAADAGPPAALALFNRDSMKTFQIHKLNSSLKIRGVWPKGKSGYRGK